MGIEPTHKGFADLSLTTWVPRLDRLGKNSPRGLLYPDMQNPRYQRGLWGILERETGFEPATSTLARSHSTTELLPLYVLDYSGAVHDGQQNEAQFMREYSAFASSTRLPNVAPFGTSSGAVLVLASLADSYCFQSFGGAQV